MSTSRQDRNRMVVSQLYSGNGIQVQVVHKKRPGNERIHKIPTVTELISKLCNKQLQQQSMRPTTPQPQRSVSCDRVEPSDKSRSRSRPESPWRSSSPRLLPRSPSPPAPPPRCVRPHSAVSPRTCTPRTSRRLTRSRTPVTASNRGSRPQSPATPQAVSSTGSDHSSLEEDIQPTTPSLKTQRAPSPRSVASMPAYVSYSRITQSRSPQRKPPSPSPTSRPPSPKMNQSYTPILQHGQPITFSQATVSSAQPLPVGHHISDALEIHAASSRPYTPTQSTFSSGSIEDRVPPELHVYGSAIPLHVDPRWVHIELLHGLLFIICLPAPFQHCAHLRSMYT